MMIQTMTYYDLPNGFKFGYNIITNNYIYLILEILILCFEIPTHILAYSSNYSIKNTRDIQVL